MSKQLPYRALGAETDQDGGVLHAKSFIVQKAFSKEGISKEEDISRK